jgi:putative polyhydroxyalkanoate system protein
MAHIDIEHFHTLPQPQAREAVEEMAAKLADRFGLACAWEGDALHFSRSGVDGQIALAPGLVRVTAKLGFLLSAMQGSIEAEIRRVLDEKFR